MIHVHVLGVYFKTPVPGSSFLKKHKHMTNSGTALQTSTPANTPEASPFTPPRRKVVGFVRSEPGYMISGIIAVFLFLNGIIFGGLAILSAETDIRGPVQAFEEYEIYDIIGVSIFCLWNSIVWSLMLIFPSITTTKRERVRKRCMKNCII